MWIYDFAFVANFETVANTCFQGGLPRLLRYYIGGLSKFITILHGGGLPNLLQYYNGGGVSRDPKFVLRNIWTAPNHLSLYYVLSVASARVPNPWVRCAVANVLHIWVHLVLWLAAACT